MQGAPALPACKHNVHTKIFRHKLLLLILECPSKLVLLILECPSKLLLLILECPSKLLLLTLECPSKGSRC
jgi:hypothetical protein